MSADQNEAGSQSGENGSQAGSDMTSGSNKSQKTPFHPLAQYHCFHFESCDFGISSQADDETKKEFHKMGLKQKISTLCHEADGTISPNYLPYVFLKPAGWARPNVVAATTEEELIRALYGRSVWALMGIKIRGNDVIFAELDHQRQFAQVIRNYCPYLYDSRTLLESVLKKTDDAKNKSAPDNFSKDMQEKMTEIHLQIDALVAQKQFYEMYFADNLSLWQSKFGLYPHLMMTIFENQNVVTLSLEAWPEILQAATSWALPVHLAMTTTGMSKGFQAHYAAILQRRFEREKKNSMKHGAYQRAGRVPAFKDAPRDEKDCGDDDTDYRFSGGPMPYGYSQPGGSAPPAGAQQYSDADQAAQREAAQQAEFKRQLAELQRRQRQQSQQTTLIPNNSGNVPVRGGGQGNGLDRGRGNGINRRTEF